MDTKRFEELKEKRSEEGLSHEEAHELGRMIAEREGKPYSSHDDLQKTEDEPTAWDEAAKHGEEEDHPEQATPAPAEDHEPEEERAVGTKREPMAPTGSGYLPPKGSDEQPS